MKLEIDFTNKTIQIKSDVNISDFFNELHEILGDKVNEFKLIPNEIIYNIPTYIPNTEPIIQPFCNGHLDVTYCANK